MFSSIPAIAIQQTDNAQRIARLESFRFEAEQELQMLKTWVMLEGAALLAIVLIVAWSAFVFVRASRGKK